MLQIGDYLNVCYINITLINMKALWYALIQCVRIVDQEDNNTYVFFILINVLVHKPPTHKFKITKNLKKSTIILNQMAIAVQELFGTGHNTL